MKEEKEREKKEKERKKKENDDKFRIMDLNLLIYMQRTNNLERKNNLILNSYKIIYLRKIANIILDIILKTYKPSLYKTENIFIDITKPNYKTKYFQ